MCIRDSPLLWLAALLLRPAAQDGGLSLSARAGFDGLYKEMDAVPVFVSVRNDGPPIEGEIRIAVDSMSGGPVVYSAPVSLPTGSDKRVALYVHVLPFAGDLAVQLVSGETVVAAVETNPLNMTPPDDLLYGIVTADPGGLANEQPCAAAQRNPGPVSYTHLDVYKRQVSGCDVDP